MKNLEQVLIGVALASSVLCVHAEVGQPERLLSSNCFQCHGTNGKGPGFDSLAGKSANEIYKELKEFQSGKEGKGIMAKHTMVYTDAQMRQISTWFSTQK